MSQTITPETSRVADVLRTESQHQTALFARALARHLPGQWREEDIVTALARASEDFPDREQYLDAMVEALQRGERIWNSAMDDPTLSELIEWPEVYREPYGYSFRRCGHEDPFSEAENDAPLDWLTPGVDDVVIIKTLYQNRLEADRHFTSWNGARMPDDPQEMNGKHGAAIQACPQGFVVGAWMPSAWNLIVLRDARHYNTTSIRSIIAPDGVLIGEDDLPEEIFEHLRCF